MREGVCVPWVGGWGGGVVERQRERVYERGERKSVCVCVSMILSACRMFIVKSCSHLATTLYV